MHSFETAAIVLIFIVLSIGTVCAHGIEVPFKELPKTELSLDLDGQNDEWTREEGKGNEARYTRLDHTLTLRLENKGKQHILHFKLIPPSGQTLSVQSYTIKVSLPTTGLYAVMVPNTRPIGKQLEYYHDHRVWRENVNLYRCLVPETFQEKAQVNNEAPLILITDSKHNNKFCIGWTGADRATMLYGAAEGDNYTLTLTRHDDTPFSGDSLEDAVVINKASDPWTDVERDYAKAFDRYNGRRHSPIPEWLYEPTFCTWYSYEDRINQKMILELAKKCRELGIRTLLIDAGWDAKPGIWWGDLDKGAIGDFAASPELFPDLPGLVKQLHEMGIRVELWTCPFWQAKGSRSYNEKTKSWMSWTEDREDIYLCPKHPGTRQMLFDRFARVAKTYGIDGMWIDASDGVTPKCTAKHEHIEESMGKAWVGCMTAVRDGLKSVNPEAVTEARILHANLNSKIALDSVQCGDSPKGCEMIRLAQIHLRPWAYDIVLKTDPTLWWKGTDIPTIGKYMATLVTSGVPALGVDILTAPEQECKVIKAWLDFYNKHRKTLLQGRFCLFGENVGIPDMMFTAGTEAIIYMKNPKTTEVDLPKIAGRTILLNCTNSDTLKLRISPAIGAYKVQAYLPDWSQSGEQSTVDATGGIYLNHQVPQGGAIVVKREAGNP